MTLSRRRLVGLIGLLVLVLAGLLRFAQWGAPLTLDETIVMQAYLSRPAATIAAAYDNVGNHILASLVIRLASALSSKELFDALADIRLLQLPSILASVATLLVLWRVAVLLASPPVAVLAAAFLGVSFWHLAYSHMLRGYSLSVLLNLAGAWLLLEALLRRKAWPWWALPATLAAAHYTVPTNVFYTLALAAWACVALAGRRPAARRKASRKGASRGKPLQTPPSSGAWSEGRSLLAVAAAGAALTLAVYAPVLKDMRRHAAERGRYLEAREGGAARLLDEYSRVLGGSRPLAVFYAAVAGVGVASALRRRGTRRLAGWLLASYLCVPVAGFYWSGIPGCVRFQTSCLPFWAMAFALGLQGLSVRLSRRLGLKAGAPALVAAGVVFVSALASPQVADFLRWNRGVDPRRVMLWLVDRVRSSSDFVVLCAQMGEGLPRAKGLMQGFEAQFAPLRWEYYAMRAHIKPYSRFLALGDHPYLLRSRYFILAADRASAEATLARSAIDPLLAEGLREAGAVGRVRIFTLDLDDGALARYRWALASAGAPAALRGQALTGLGYDALRRSAFAEAVGFLEKAKRLAPGDERARYLLGMAYYLSFDDARAEGEFAWCVARDTENVHAPVYYGDVLAAQGRVEDAMVAYARYDRSVYRGMPEDAWIFERKAASARAELRRGVGPVIMRASAPEALGRAADAYIMRGGYERAALLLSRANRARPTVDRLMALAACSHFMFRYADSVRLMREAVQAGGGVEVKLSLANELMLTHEIAEAEGLVRGVLSGNPGRADAKELLARLRRL
ncbi:MAG: hypothetical protein HY927_16895 [Elusimicrobia bacterium]|nr:hypothetical protein [Elusimicrobiota bacterium]